LPSRLPLFAVAPPGLEDLTRAELFALGINHPRAVPGGVEFEGFLSHLYRVNLWSRAASRVLVRLGEFQAVAFDELRRKAADLPWEKFLRPGQPVNVRAACHKSKLYHSDAVAERVVSAIQDHLGQESKIEPQRRNPAKKSGAGDRKEEKENLASFASSRLNSEVIVRIDHDYCTVSLNSSGAHLHQRGYRLQTAKAPLRETLAAALLLHASYNPTQPLLDPFCGSGTFAIEAALMARNIAPGLSRRFAFIDWANFDTREWGEQLKKARAAINDSAPIIIASDRDEGAITAAQANAKRAGVADSIQFSARPISAIEPPPAPGLLISNLPYGNRVGDDVRNLYAQFGKVAKEKCPGWRVGIVAGSMALAKQTRLAFGEPLMIENGGLRVPFVRADLTGF
jgi:putative N6-adenine-specific DNA methylase